MNLLLPRGLVFYVYVGICISNVRCLTPVKPCKKDGAVAVVVDMRGCEAPPCVAKKGTNFESEIVFTPDQDYEKVTVGIVVELMGVKRGFPGKDGTDACEYLYTNPGKVKAGCPLKAGVEYVYDIPLFIEKHFLKITANTIWSIKDKKTKKDIWCFEVPLKVT